MKKEKPVTKRSKKYLQKRDLLAHLALAADRSAVPGDCPDNEAFARFLEIESESDDRQKMLDHISTCEACYQKWLSVSDVLDAESEKETATRFLNRRLMTAAGSACALAVGVMLYLSIDYQPLIKTDMERSVATVPAPVSPVIEEIGEGDGLGKTSAPMRNLQELSSSDEQIDGVEVESKPPADKVMAEYRVGKGRRAEVPEQTAAPLQSGDAAIDSEPQKEVTVQAMVREKSVQTGNRLASPVQDQELSKTDGAALFIEQFVALCGDFRDNRLKQSTVEKLVEQGRSLLRAGNLPADEQGMIDEISEILEQHSSTEKTTFSEVCERATEFGRRKGYHVNNVNSQ